MQRSLDITAQNILKWAEDRDLLKNAKPLKQALKLVSEVGELADNVVKENEAKIADDIGDCFVCLTILAAQYNMTIEDCAEVAYDSIKNRGGVNYNGVFIKAEDPRYESALALKNANKESMLIN